MGTGWFVQRETSGPRPLPHGGRALLFAQYQLEEFAREIGLEPLKSFFSPDPAAVARYFQDQGLDPADFDLPDEEWFDPADALPTVRSLLSRLDTDPGVIPGLDKVRADLAAIAESLAELDETGERFHLASGLPDLTDREPPG
jgi:hypothetical protein